MAKGDYLRDKAANNLQAATSLGDLGLHAPAVSRLYYAAFQATIITLDLKPVEWHRKNIVHPLKKGGNWDHYAVCCAASAVRASRGDIAAMHALMGSRHKADYQDVPPEPAILALRLPMVRAMVQVAEATRGKAP